MRRIWLWPTVIGIASLTGLVAGLMLDSWGDFLAWMGLGLPVATGVIDWRGRYTSTPERLNDIAARECLQPRAGE